MIVDSHCHLNYEVFNNDFAAMLARAKANGVNIFQTISTKIADFAQIKEIIEQYPEIYASIGIHPHEVDEHEEISVEQLFEFTKHKKVIGIGETGLDFYYKHSSEEKQIEYFLRHIEVAHLSKLPLIIHTRDADAKTLDILSKAKKRFDYTGLIHCFSSNDLSFAQECLNLGLYISISGIVTFKKAFELQEIVKHIPIEKLLVETDSPYLAPEPYRGKSNEPSYVVKVVEKIADLKNISFNQVADTTTENFYCLFNKVNKA
jgi:TatD DNase family protein